MKTKAFAPELGRAAVGYPSENEAGVVVCAATSAGEAANARRSERKNARAHARRRPSAARGIVARLQKHDERTTRRENRREAYVSRRPVYARNDESRRAMLPSREPRRSPGNPRARGERAVMLYAERGGKSQQPRASGTSL